MLSLLIKKKKKIFFQFSLPVFAVQLKKKFILALFYVSIMPHI